MNIASLRLKSEYVHIGQLYFTVLYGGELMQFGYRWSTGICVSSAPSVAYSTVDASAQMTFLGLSEAKLLNETDYHI